MTEVPPPSFSPNLLLLVNGKRKSGKDYVVDLVKKRLGDKLKDVAFLAIAAPIKRHWAEVHDLDFAQLLTDGPYKEIHRAGMVAWSIEKRASSPGFFPTEAIKLSQGEGKNVWIVSDIRHRGDFDYFLKYYSKITKTIKVVASQETRKERGWVFSLGVDDGPSECDLDDRTEWDMKIENNGDDSTFAQSLDDILQWIEDALKQ